MEDLASLNALASDLWRRYNDSNYESRNMEDLDQVISLRRSALTLCQADLPNHSLSIHNLAIALRTRYTELGNIEDLEECIAMHRDALSFRPPGHPDRSGSLNNLAIALRTRFAQLGDMGDLEECLALNRDALVLRPLGQPNRSMSLNNLANALSDRYHQLGKIEDLEECLALNREALALRLPNQRNYSLSLNNLANVLNTRYGELGKMEDLEECIALNRDALALRLPGHPSRSSSLDNLAVALWSRYGRLGEMKDLEECIALNREALPLRPPGHCDRPMSLSNLAIALSDRYDHSGKMEDLDECISLHRDALSFRPPGHIDRSISLSNLATALWSRYRQVGKMDDLEEGITLNREALALRLPGHPDRSMSLNNLANALWSRYKLSGKMEDLEERIALYRESLTFRLPGHPNYSLSLSNLAGALSDRYQRLGKMEDLEECITLYRDALTLRLPGHPDRSFSLKELANVLHHRYGQSHKVEDLREMFNLYEQGANDSTSYIKHRLDTAVQWAEDARYYQHESALNAYTIGLQLLQRSLIYRHNVEGQHEFLAAAKEHTSLASDAASFAIATGKLELAVEFLEQGRSLLWSRIDAYKYPLEQLRQVEGGGKLADRLEILSSELEWLVLLSDRNQTDTLNKEFSTASPGGMSLDDRIKHHRILCEEWEGLVGRIREKPGFQHFLKTSPFDTLQSAAADGPVILLNISTYRSDAIILTINKPPILVSLSSGKPAGLADQADRLTTNQGIITVLRYLWEKIVSPVVACLDDLGVHKNSRIWWCPTGELCGLPLHAAGPYRLQEKNLPDMYISSYATTLSSLIRARLNVQPPQVPKVLVIGQHNETLRNVKEEVESIEHHAGAVDLILGPRATREIVLNHLKQHSWVHFACHGHLGDNNQPFHASFELYDGLRLTLLELIRARLQNAECAFLSACHTAGGDSRTPDENIHLSAALQFCGFRSVVGTLWEMFDDDGPMISKEFYKYMFRNPDRIDFRDSAHALSSAVRAMRRARLPPERWVMFVHIGA